MQSSLHNINARDIQTNEYETKNLSITRFLIDLYQRQRAASVQCFGQLVSWCSANVSSSNPPVKKLRSISRAYTYPEIRCPLPHRRHRSIVLCKHNDYMKTRKFRLLSVGVASHVRIPCTRDLRDFSLYLREPTSQIFRTIFFLLLSRQPCLV